MNFHEYIRLQKSVGLIHRNQLNGDSFNYKFIVLKFIFWNYKSKTPFDRVDRS